METKALAENQSGQTIKYVRSDEGKEYLGEMIQAVKGFGIIHEQTAAFSQESNGISERFNRTIMNMVRSVLKQSNISPAKGFKYALHYAVYIINRLPSQTSKPLKSPYEKWFGSTPTISHIRPFGCIAYGLLHRNLAL